MLDLKALPVLRRNLREFVRADPIMVTITRPVLTRTAAAGYKKTSSSTLAPQQFRLVPFKRRLSDYTSVTPHGTYSVEYYVLVGEVTVDIRRDDTFELNGDHYRVVSVEPKTEDRTKTDRVVAEIRIEQEDKAPVVV